MEEKRVGYLTAEVNGHVVVTRIWCPECGRNLDQDDKIEVCNTCGQHLNWDPIIDIENEG